MSSQNILPYSILQTHKAFNKELSNSSSIQQRATALALTHEHQLREQF